MPPLRSVCQYEFCKFIKVNLYDWQVDSLSDLSPGSIFPMNSVLFFEEREREFWTLRRFSKFKVTIFRPTYRLERQKSPFKSTLPWKKITADSLSLTRSESAKWATHSEWTRFMCIKDKKVRLPIMECVGQKAFVEASAGLIPRSRPERSPSERSHHAEAAVQWLLKAAVF